MKAKKILSLLVLLAGITAQAQMMQLPPIPADTAVRTGRLPNGLTYYIRYNNWPENRAEFYIAQRVGSLQEEESQRGLAHFLEHMCFNGTEHFPGNEVMRYCESIGVQFGRDLNAYTAIDQTVYNISNVPTARQSALDSCLLILYDWANGLLLDPDEIDKERGVIHEEYRLRTSAAMRMFERSLPKLYPGSKYGHRMPIGLMSVVDSFKPQTLRDYYEKWYRPDNQGIIVVGDVDVDHVEAEIKRLFSPIEMPADPAPVVTEPVPDNAEPIIVIDKDKEQRVNTMEVIFKHEATPDSAKNNMGYVVARYMTDLALAMLNARLDEYAQKSESPFVSASAIYASYIFAKTKDALDISALPKDGQAEATLAAMLREARRAAEHGFTPTEYARAKADAMSALDKMYSNKDKRYSAQFCEEYKQHFLSGEPIPSIDYYYATMMQLIPNIPLEAVNAVMKELVPASGGNMVVISFNSEKDGAAYPTEQGVKEAMAAVQAEKLTPYVDNVKDEPLIKQLPAKGSIAGEKADTLLGYKELTLSNGAKVILKHTDYKKDQVLLQAEGLGGSSLYGQADYPNIKLFDDAIAASGLGAFSHTELEKALAGKIATASMSLSSQRQYINGSSTPQDVETLLQLVYLHFTAINKDQASYDNLMRTAEIALKNKALSPDNAFADSLNATLNSHNPRFASPTVDDLKHVSYDRILEMARELTANAAAYTFTIVGNFDEAKLRPLIEQYIASLPAKATVRRGPRVDTDAKGQVVNSFERKMETPKAITAMVWTNDAMPYTLENTIRADMAGQVLSMVYLKKIREDAGAAYSVGAQGTMTRLDDKIDCGIFAYCPMKYEMADTVLTILRAEVEAMATSCDGEMLEKVKEFMLKSYDDATKTNSYWLGVIDTYRTYGTDLHSAYRQTVAEQSTQSVSAFVKQLISQGNRAEVTMMPALGDTK